MSGLLKHLLEFGDFRLDTAERRLLRSGEPVALAPKAFDLLVVLVENRGRLVGKDDLMRRLWPDSFVEETNLAYNVSALRKALDDTADVRRYIETVPKRGYRFTAEVREVGEEPAVGLSVPNDLEKLEEDTGRIRIVESGKGFHWWWAAVGAVVLLGIGWLWTGREKGSVEQALPQTSVLTSLSGNEQSPRFSPDGHYVAFSWNGPGEDNWDIYVQMIDTRELTRRTSDRAEDFNPAWSPDGRYIAFGRSDGQTGRLILIPVHGGREHVLVTAPTIENRRTWSISERLEFTSGWGPEGKWLVSSIPDKDWVGLVGISVATGERRQLTMPSKRVWDTQPAVSPDGRSIVFVREQTWTTKDLYLLRLSETGEPRGEPQRLTFENDRLFSPVWSADGRSILYSYAGHLWQIDVGEPGKGMKLMSWGGEPHANPNFDVSHRTNRLVFELRLQDPNIYRIEISDSGGFGPPEKIIASTRIDRGPAYSRDGQKIAFASERSGFHEIWICDSEGDNPFQLTNFSGPIGGSPTWSPDDSRIAYDFRVEGLSHIYVISSTGGQATKLTNDTHQSSMPRWSRDGKWIYYTRRASGLWKIPAEGGVPLFVVDGGNWVRESYDGQFFYFYRDGSIWRIPTKGGKEEFFLKTIGFASCFDVVKDGIFFLSEKTSSGSSFLSFYSFASGKVEPVVEVARAQPGVSATQDGRSVLYAQIDQEGSDLMLLENFHGIGERRDSNRGRRSGSAAVLTR